MIWFFLGKITRDHRLPWITLAIAIYRQHKIRSLDESILSVIARYFEGNSTIKVMIGDMIGLYLIVFLFRSLMSARRTIESLTFKTLKNEVGNRVVTVLKVFPQTRKKIEEQMKKVEESIESSLKNENRVITTTIPNEGIPHEEILSRMNKLCDEEKPQWKGGTVSGAVYHGGDNHMALQADVFRLFSVTNPLHPDLWPSVMQCEAEVAAMTANLLNGGNKEVCGSLTTGGTESIILATKAHRQWAAKTLGITNPEVVAPVTAHAGIDKACDILGIKLIKVPVSEETFVVDSKILEKYISPDTIMIFSSAPQFPHGVIDPIADLSRLAIAYGIGLHVDCCLGGFVLPFARKLGYDIPRFDFELPGVTSMSCDTHKYGYAVKGTSVVLYKNSKFREYMYFTFPDWPGGLYATPSTPGSRAGALIAACWASLVAMGEQGFLTATKAILETQRKIKQAVRDIDGIELCGNPDVMIVAFRSKRFNIYNLSKKLHRKGWVLNNLQYPACVHICVTLLTATGDAGERFCDDLRECTAECLENPDLTEEGAALYGMASALPAGPINEVLCSYTNIVLKP